MQRDGREGRRVRGGENGKAASHLFLGLMPSLPRLCPWRIPLTCCIPQPPMAPTAAAGRNPGRPHPREGVVFLANPLEGDPPITNDIRGASAAIPLLPGIDECWGLAAATHEVVATRRTAPTKSRVACILSTPSEGGKKTETAQRDGFRLLLLDS